MREAHTYIAQKTSPIWCEISRYISGWHSKPQLGFRSQTWTRLHLIPYSRYDITDPIPISHWQGGFSLSSWFLYISFHFFFRGYSKDSDAKLYQCIRSCYPVHQQTLSYKRTGYRLVNRQWLLIHPDWFVWILLIYVNHISSTAINLYKFYNEM